MPTRLRFDGVNDYCQFSSSMSIDLGLAAYTFEAKLVLNATPTALGGLLGRNGTSAGFFITSTLSLAAYTSGTLRYQTAANFFLQDGNVHTYRLEHDSGGAWRAYRDGTLISSGTFSTTTVAAPLIWIGQGNNSSNSYCSMDLEYLEVTGVTNAQKWDANLGGSGTTLPTTSGTNQATQINFPTDNSQWISVSGGGAVLQAAATGVSTATAALTTAIALAAAAVGVSSATASLTTGIPLQASAAGVSTATAQLSTQVRLNASALGVSSATASLTTSIRLAASALGQSSATVNLTTGGGGLSANAIGQSTATATLATAIRLTASAVAQATATATLVGTSAQLAAAAVGVSTATAALSISIRLQASSVALASSMAQLTTQIRLSAAGYSVSVAAAELTIGQVLPPEIDAYKMKMTRITGNYKLQQQVSFSIINATPKFKIGRA